MLLSNCQDGKNENKKLTRVSRHISFTHPQLIANNADLLRDMRSFQDALRVFEEEFSPARTYVKKALVGVVGCEVLARMFTDSVVGLFLCFYLLFYTLFRLKLSICRVITNVFQNTSKS